MTSVTTSTELQVGSMPNITSFPLFAQLPTEIRFKIWKLCFVPCRVCIYNASYRPKLPFETSTLLRVNREAAQIFKEKYLKFFHTKGQAPMLLNPEIDILCFDSGLKSLAKIARQYPKHMHRLRYIEVFAGLRTAGPPDPTEWLKMDLRCLPAQCLITVRGCHCHEGRESFYPPRDCKCHESKSGVRIIAVLAYLKKALLRYEAPGAQRYTGPRLAALFQASFSFYDWIYFETTTDLHHVRYGRVNPASLKADSISKMCQRRVQWLALDASWNYTEARVPWETYPNNLHTDVFHHMQAARIPCLAEDELKKKIRARRRELWTCFTGIGDDRYGTQLETWHVEGLAYVELSYYKLRFGETRMEVGKKMAEILESLGVVSVRAENPRIVGPLAEYYQARREAGEEPRRDYCAIKCLVDGHLLANGGAHDHCF